MLIIEEFSHLPPPYELKKKKQIRIFSMIFLSFHTYKSFHGGHGKHTSTEKLKLNIHYMNWRAFKENIR